MRICIFGGTFDPPHIGHLLIAQTVCEAENFDKILFMPANKPPHKKSASEVEDRLAMLKIAIEGNPNFEISDMEIKRGGVSYTIDTLKEMKSSVLKEKDDLFKSPEDQIILLENIRFYKEEEKNDASFAKHLASLADLYVNDAFSCSHRAHASVSKITEFLPSFAGLQLETELSALKKVTTEIKKPITCIIGGSKISTKIDIIKNLIPKFDNIIIVGGMANNIISYKGNNIGKSIKEEN